MSFSEHHEVESDAGGMLLAARAGYDVALIEKEPQLGGWLKNFGKLFPKRPPYRPTT